MLKKTSASVCRNCNSPITKGDKVCASCGAKITKPFYKKWWVILIAIIVIAMIVPKGCSDGERFKWSDIELSDKLPEPKSNVGDIISNDTDSLSISLYRTSKSDYKEYVKECEDMGYTIESENDGNSFSAFDKDGYELRLSLYEEDKKMSISLDAPIKMSEISWPSSGLAQLLPKPKSNIGYIERQAEDGFRVKIGNTPISDFNAYIDECHKKGFSVEYDRGDKWYNAKDKNGNKLRINYIGNNVMSIDIHKEDKATEDVNDTESKEENSSSSNSTQLVDGMRPEFKQAMDSYESVMNEYCSFMKKYSEGKESATDYAKYVKKYNAAMKDFEAWDNGELNETETDYYIEVQTRINNKLMELV